MYTWLNSDKSAVEICVLHNCSLGIPAFGNQVHSSQSYDATHVSQRANKHLKTHENAINEMVAWCWKLKPKMFKFQWSLVRPTERYLHVEGSHYLVVPAARSLDHSHRSTSWACSLGFKDRPAVDLCGVSWYVMVCSWRIDADPCRSMLIHVDLWSMLIPLFDVSWHCSIEAEYAGTCRNYVELLYRPVWGARKESPGPHPVAAVGRLHQSLCSPQFMGSTCLTALQLHCIFLTFFAPPRSRLQQHDSWGSVAWLREHVSQSHGGLEGVGSLCT